LSAKGELKNGFLLSLKNKLRSRHGKYILTGVIKNGFIVKNTYNRLLLTNPAIREMINRITKIQNRILAMPTAPAAMPPKPKMAAIMAMIRKTTAQPNIIKLF
jgi:hypothetical protein